MLIKKEKYIKLVQRSYPPLWSSLVLTGAINKTHYKPFLRRPYARRNTIILDYAWYYLISNEEELSRIIQDEWTDKKRLNQVIQRLAKRERDLLNAVTIDFRNLCSKFEAYMPTIGLVYLAEPLFYGRTKKLLERKLSSKETEELLGWLNIPLKDNFYKKEEYDLVTTENIKKHVKKYKWILSRYGIDISYTEKDARKKLSGIDRHKFLKDYDTNKRIIKRAIIKAKKILGQNEAYLINGLQFIVFYRTHRTDIINKVAYFYIPFLKNIASKYGLSYGELLMCTKDEVLNKKIPSKTLLADRAKGHAMIIDKNKVQCLIGKEYKNLKQIFKDRIKRVEIIRGNIASRGLKRGAVKVILERNDFSKMSQDDILVTSMTTPEMMSVMKKAAAFITDEGGITCHAAIMSREMNKPCIIGTRIATKILKDGDLVEVDAHKGIVKIIKNKT